MIDEHEAAAKASGARMVFSCGFNSIPFDLGAFFSKRKRGSGSARRLPRVKGRVRDMGGGLSGGTAASGGDDGRRRQGSRVIGATAGSRSR